MVGALFQLLPVLAGLVLPRPRWTAPIVHLTLTCGAISLAASFLWPGFWLLVFSLGNLALGFGVLWVVLILGLLQARASSVFLGALRYALAALVLTVVLGMTLLMARYQALPVSYQTLADLHPQWGLYGWTMLLVMGVADALIPLFLLTPAYPKRVGRSLLPGLMVVLSVKTLASWVSAPLAAPLESACNAVLAMGCVLFAAITLRLLQSRKRKVTDISIFFWKMGMLALLLAGVMGLLLPFAPPDVSENVRMTIGVLFLPGFLVAVIHGMLYKIIPFLTWFHLQSAYPRSGVVPNVRELQAPYRVRQQRVVYLISLLLLIVSCWLPVLTRMAGILWAVDALWLGSNVLGSAMTYKRVQNIARSRSTA